MINSNTRSLKIVVDWSIITTVLHKNIKPKISANAFQYPFGRLLYIIIQVKTI